MEVSTKTRPLLIENQNDLNSEEFLPDLWRAAENLVGLDDKVRFQALGFLQELDIIRYSPLLIYLICTRLDDPNSKIRFLAVQLILSILEPDEFGQPVPTEIRKELCVNLSALQEKSLVSILQTSLDYSDLRSQISKLINYCPDAGSYLVSILSDRKYPIEIRRQAVDLIGLIGYVDTLPTLLRLKNRFESRANNISGIQSITASLDAEKSLLHSINTALTLIQKP